MILSESRATLPLRFTEEQPMQPRCRLNGSAVFTTSFSKQINRYITQVCPFYFLTKE